MNIRATSKASHMGIQVSVQQRAPQHLSNVASYLILQRRYRVALHVD